MAVARAVLPARMTAAVLYGIEDLRIEQVDVPVFPPTKFFCACDLHSPMEPT